MGFIHDVCATRTVHIMAQTGIYLTWVTAAILCSVALMPLLRPRFVRHSWSAYVDMFRRYWFHMLIVFSVYLWKDPLDQIDRALMASTRIEITPYIYAIEGDVLSLIHISEPTRL